MKWFLTLVVLIAAVGGVLWAYKNTEHTAAASMRTITISQQNIVVTGTGLAKVEVWIVPSGTNVTEADNKLLGTALLTPGTADSVQEWKLPVPNSPMNITSLYARGYDDHGAVVGQVTFEKTGATALYDALWGATAPQGITWVDSGRTFVFTPTSHFSVVLDSTRYPQKSLVCKPTGVIASASGAPTVAAPLYATSFQALNPPASGSECWLTSGDFSAQIRVVSDPSSTTRFSDAKNGYSITYPARVTKTPGSDGDLYSSTSLIRLDLARNDPAIDTTGTNLGEAAVLIGISKEAGKVATCEKPQAQETPTGTKTIGDQAFSGFVSHDAGAGNRYDVTSYRIMHGGACYEVATFIHYGVLENYDPGVAHAFDEAAVQRALDDIADNFNFNS